MTNIIEYNVWVVKRKRARTERLWRDSSPRGSEGEPDRLDRLDDAEGAEVQETDPAEDDDETDSLNLPFLLVAE